MDNTQPAANPQVNTQPTPQMPPQAPVTPPPAAATPTVPVMPQQPASEGRSPNKLVVFLILGVVVIALIVGGVYWYLSSKQSADLKNNQTSALPVASPAAEENLENDLNAINVATDESDFTTVDQDINGL